MPQNKVNIPQKVSRADIGFANRWISQHPLTVLGMAVAMGVVALALFFNWTGIPADRTDLLFHGRLGSYLFAISCIYFLYRSIRAFARPPDV